jgi:hypothetical protein
MPSADREGRAQAPSFRAGLGRPPFLFDVLPDDAQRRTSAAK